MKFSHFDNRIQLGGPSKVTNHLEKGVYLYGHSPMTGSYLNRQEDFTLPPRIYGDYDIIAKRYLNTFKNKRGNLGILLVGEKGSGKTLLAKKVCIESNLPVILITDYYEKNTIEEFLTSITQEAIVFIDEFEKVYPDSVQPDLLSILEGSLEGRKIFLFTSNSDKISTYMLNRPGRIHYLKRFEGLSPDIIEEIIESNLLNKDHKKELLEVLDIVGIVNMDILLSLINEMNLYGESAKQSVKELNILPDSRTTFDADVFYRGEYQGQLYLSESPLLTQEIDVGHVYGSEAKDEFKKKYKYNPIFVEDYIKTAEGFDLILEDKDVTVKIKKQTFKMSKSFFA